MRDEDFDTFQSMLDAASGLISRGRYTPSAEGAAIFFESLRAYELAQVSAALTAHLKDPERGKFAPSPADIIAKIEAMSPDGRPGAEEAWAMMPASEAHTVVWTAEMAEAYGICAPLLQAGDRVGARMAFKEAYERLVAQAKLAGRSVVWQPSLGSDMRQRKEALTLAVEQGKLTAEDAHEACPALPMPESHRLQLPAPQPGRRQSFKQTVSALAEAKRHESRDPLAWARILRDREKAGEDLSIGQKDAWRKALDLPQASSMPVGGFEPIPEHLLPPGMRKPTADPRPQEGS